MLTNECIFLLDDIKLLAFSWAKVMKLISTFANFKTIINLRNSRDFKI